MSSVRVCKPIYVPAIHLWNELGLLSQSGYFPVPLLIISNTPLAFKRSRYALVYSQLDHKVMDVKVFKTFLEVAKTRHFGRAADNLFIAQAAVSARVKQLEAFIGSPLFERAGNNIQLTGAGKRLIPYEETMMRALRQVKTDANMQEDDIQQISVAASPNVWVASHLMKLATLYLYQKYRAGS